MNWNTYRLLILIMDKHCLSFSRILLHVYKCMFRSFVCPTKTVMLTFYEQDIRGVLDKLKDPVSTPWKLLYFVYGIFLSTNFVNSWQRLRNAPIIFATSRFEKEKGSDRKKNILNTKHIWFIFSKVYILSY